MENAPDTIPAPPAPATARPPMNILELTAVAHSREPNSKTAKKLRNVHYNRLDLHSRTNATGGTLLALRENVA